MHKSAHATIYCRIRVEPGRLYSTRLAPYFFQNCREDSLSFDDPGLAIHVQTWATFYARPRRSRTSLQAISTGSPISSLTPRALNSIMISIGLLFALSIVIGRIIATIQLNKLMNSFLSILTALEVARLSGADITSLVTLFPTFLNLESQGMHLRNIELTCGKVNPFADSFLIFLEKIV